MPIPIGSQDAELLDSHLYDSDVDEELVDGHKDIIQFMEDEGLKEKEFLRISEFIYKECKNKFETRFKWLRHDLFIKALKTDLAKDVKVLIGILNECGIWKADNDPKLAELYDLITNKHPKEKIIIFTQYADTVEYLVKELKTLGGKNRRCDRKF